MTIPPFSFKPNQLGKAPLQQRIATLAQLIAELRELQELRERVRKATLLAASSRRKGAGILAVRKPRGLSRLPGPRPAAAAQEEQASDEPLW